MPLVLPKRAASIVVFASTGIGSGLFCSAAIKSLKRTHPAAKISVVAHHRRMTVALHDPHVDQVLPYSKSPFAWLPLLAKLKRLQPDLVVALRLNEDAVPLGYLANRRGFVGSAKRCKSLSFLLSRVVETPGDMHSVDEMLAIARAAGGSADKCGMVYKVTSQEADAMDRRFAEWISDPFIIWQVGATTRNDARVYPVDMASRAVAAIAKAAKPRIVLTGGEPEMDVAVRIAQACPSVINICGLTNLEETAAIVQRAKLVVARDTGVMHLAVALDTPTLALMHSAKRVGLYGPPLETGRHRVLVPETDAQSGSGHPMEKLAWTSVVDCVVNMLSDPASQRPKIC